MPTAIADGPGGLECTHTINGVVLGDQAARPRYKLDRIVGLHALPESDDERRPRTGMLGEITYPSYARGKTVTYEGRVQGETLQQMRQMATALRSACQDRNSEHAMVITPHASYGSDHWGYYARVLQLDMDDEQVRGPFHLRGPYQRDFVLGLRMSDPRFYWKLSGGAGLAASGSQASGATYNAVNAGNAPADPVFTIVVPSGLPDVVLTNTSVATSNGTARIRLNNVAAGTVTVDFPNRRITRDGTDIMRAFDTVYNQWWDELIPGLNPGSNNLSVSACTSWSVVWWHRSW